MKKFMDEDFILNNATAVNLYHKYAKDLPIIDYHCHIMQQEIYDNKQFKNITEVWLYGDHYKWRAMRSCGVDENLITGDADDYAKFLAWAGTVPKLIGNPLYHWTHLELQRYFDIHETLDLNTAPAIWEKTQKKLTSGTFNVQDIIAASNVEVICTTDDPADDLFYHQELKHSFKTAKVLPASRPDKAMKIAHPGFNQWREKLEQLVGFKVDSYKKLLKALELRMDFFHDNKCVVSDHALDYVPYLLATDQELEQIFAKALAGTDINAAEEEKYRTALLIFLGREYYKRGWVMQLHINAARDNNSKRFNTLGADTGFDSINDNNIVYPLANFLNALDATDSLPKTILYSLNPRDNYVLGTLIGCFQGDGIAGKIQFGSAWWFNDQRDGMKMQMEALANLGSLSSFVGMLTDSRSFLSYTRHEYFRRILCNLIGEWVENGEYPNDEIMLGKIVQDICYYNAQKYFNF